MEMMINALSVGTIITTLGATMVFRRHFLKNGITHYAIKKIPPAFTPTPSSYIYPGRVRRLVISHMVKSDPVYVGGQYAKMPIGGGSEKETLYEASVTADNINDFKWKGVISKDQHGTNRRISYMDCLEYLKNEYKIDPCDIPMTESSVVSLWESDWIDDAIIMKSKDIIFPHKKHDYDYLIGTKDEVVKRYAKDATPFALSTLFVGIAITCIGFN